MPQDIHSKGPKQDHLAFRLVKWKERNSTVKLLVCNVFGLIVPVENEEFSPKNNSQSYNAILSIWNQINRYKNSMSLNVIA